MYKKVILIVSLLFILCIFSLKSNNITQTNSVVDTNYIKVENFFESIKKIDRVILSSVFNKETNILSDEQILDLTINIISNNFDKYKIKYSDKMDMVKENGFEYYPIGYIKKNDLKKVIYDIFRRDDIDILSYKSYNVNTDTITIIPRFSEIIDYDLSSINKISKNSDNEYVLNINYIRIIGDITNKFNVEYYIKINNNKCSFIGFKIINSIINSYI
ncbi:MAG: hypothetical protein RR136_03175 [Clostridia bacterium]